jgi:hypothetical protein
MIGRGQIQLGVELFEVASEFLSKNVDRICWQQWEFYSHMDETDNICLLPPMLMRLAVDWQVFAQKIGKW